ncbi:dTDP-3-amino-3,4,6-trideoxy-alpha-D-glucose transaminase [Crossiella equi]|uniref:dTDP-3-amino-3,4,6-trideoxy-alpha-D-glucose transaminase n=1 Tax=Crossiella equi TaxID=130796 RepID=A0ABS5AAB6_9PSEU|nr:DegT/DnrJ/EryC1/StrS family aminotransferase [Crossiella equi]MBP2473516.1 dTDP-3-amino-3,4,6-trideoxy-alpha-D-glucose transaminase [Crossiella equi]
MTVPFLDLKAPYRELAVELDEAAARVLRSGWYLRGPELAAFEHEFAAYCGAAHCVAVGSGSDAIELTLRALGIGRGDEVLVPSHTFIATWAAVTRAGATPVPVEPCPRTWLLDPANLAPAITPRTAAVIPVHLYGQAVDLAAVHAVATRHSLAVIEDAAQSHGARYRSAGTSRARTYSFYPGKNLGALGDGGAVVTDDPDLATRLRLHRDHGSRHKYHHELLATNSRLDELQAAFLRAKLPHLDTWNARRDRIATRYLTELADLPLTLPTRVPWSTHAWHLFVVASPHRDTLQEALTAEGVHTLIHYPIPVHRTEAYATDPVARSPLPIADTLAATVLSLPMGPHQPEAHTTRVIETLHRVCT